MIQISDILQVADTLKINITNRDAMWVLDNYDEDSDPSATWDLIVENLLYQIPKPKDRDFIMCAVALNLESFMKEKFPDYFDGFGYAHYYDLVIDIVDDMLANHPMPNSTGICIDWHYTDLAYTLVSEERINKVAGWSK